MRDIRDGKGGEMQWLYCVPSAGTTHGTECAETCVRSHEGVGQSRREPARDSWRFCALGLRRSTAGECSILVLGACVRRRGRVGWPDCGRQRPALLWDVRHDESDGMNVWWGRGIW